MTLPAGLSAHSSRMDDTPHIRGAISFCRAAASAREATQARSSAVPDRMIVDHAALVVGERPMRISANSDDLGHAAFLQAKADGAEIIGFLALQRPPDGAYVITTDEGTGEIVTMFRRSP